MADPATLTPVRVVVHFEFVTGEGKYSVNHPPSFASSASIISKRLRIVSGALAIPAATAGAVFKVMCLRTKL